MKFQRRFGALARKTGALVLLVSLVLQSAALACGPDTIDPIFVLTNSPDVPFTDFAKGKIGILQSTFGRKTLVVAHRYLSGGSFTEDEQHAIASALKGKPPEEQNDDAIKAWTTARKIVLPEEKDPPAIYDQRRNSGYDFFPNCTSNAFEVATQTLKDRVASYGAEDLNVHDWLQAQDVVFKNCAQGSETPGAAPAGSPQWLQKDRDYQIAASFFYSLNFTEARSRFTKIAEDAESDWQDVAGYLVCRTLVREASVGSTPENQEDLYQQAEIQLINQSARGGKYQNAAKRLLGLVKFRLHPEERVRELAQTLGEQSGNENLRQDLIDYNWLLDNFDEQVQKEEEERRSKADPTPTPTPYPGAEENEARYQAVQRGELLEFYFSPKDEEGQPNYQRSISLYPKSDATEAEVFQQVEIEIGRKLTADESKELKSAYANAVLHRQWLLSPNRKFDNGGYYDGCDEHCNELNLSLFPSFLRADELTDWILTFQSKDPKAYSHSVSVWRRTQSPAWLAVALTKATKASRGIAPLMLEAEKLDENSPAYPTIAYQLVRLRLEFNRVTDARKLLDKVITTRFEELPPSSQNLFLEQRVKLSSTVDEFLRFAMRRPALFSEDGTLGRITDLLRLQKETWSAEYNTETKEEFDRSVEERFKQFLPWDERKAFDPEATDLLNWHFSINALLEASRSQSLPDYLRRSLALSVWMRAVLLKNDQVAKDVSADLIQLAPELAPNLNQYLKADTRTQQENEALYIMLKFPNLTPYVPSGIPEFSTAEQADYYFETAWWCKPAETEYNDDGNEFPKVVNVPKFLNLQIVGTAKKEREALKAIGDGPSYLGKRVLEWAKRSPSDPRIPEALYIAIQANQSYKYGCNSWEADEETRAKLETVLKEKYSGSSWTTKLATQNQ
ncbi:MAG TPA: hypothetical protein VI306_20125 [Pyrinomonadaceae bacterium]